MDFNKLSREEFEDFCHFLMSKDYPDINKVKGLGGDSGIDSYYGNIINPTKIFQYKHFPSGKLSDSNRKSKILEDIEKANKFDPREWFFLTSLSLGIKDYEWFDTHLVKKYPHINIKIMERHKLESLALRPDYRDYLEDKFPQLYEFQKILNEIKLDSSISILQEKGFIIYDQSFLQFGRKNDEKSCWETGNFNLRDIFDNHVVRRQIIDTIIQDFKAHEDFGILLLGNAASGKTTVIKTIMIELGSEEFIVFYADRPSEILSTLLYSAFSIVSKKYKKPILIVVDNFHNSNAIEYVKFFNEYHFPKLYFLFAANKENFESFQKSLYREDRSNIDKAKSRLKLEELRLTESDSTMFCSRMANIYNRTVSLKYLQFISKTFLDVSRNNLLVLLCSLKELFSKEGKPQFDSKSFEKCLENDFGNYTSYLDDKQLWKEGVNSLLLSSFGIKITNTIIKQLGLDLLKINELVSHGLLLEEEDGSRRSKHDSWAVGFINYIIRDRFSDDVETFIEQYKLDNTTLELLESMDKRELIILLERIGMVASDNFELGRKLIPKIDEKIFSKFSNDDKSDILCFGIARCYSYLNEVTRTITAYEHALKFNPENFAAINNLGNVYEYLGDHGKAIGYYDLAKTKNPESGEPDYNIAQILEMQGDLYGALAHINFSISTNDRYLSSYGVKGNILSKLKNYHEAEVCYNKVLTSNPINNVSILGLGNVNFNKLCDKFPSLTHNMIFQIAFEDVILVYNMLKYFQMYVELYPYDMEGFYNLGKAQTLLGFLISSIENLEKALTFEDANLPILLSQMNNYLFIKDYSSAEFYLKLILDIDPDNFVALHNQNFITNQRKFMRDFPHVTQLTMESLNYS